MARNVVTVKITGLDQLERKYKSAARNAEQYMSAAAREAVERYVLPVEGVKQYPPETAANKPGRVRSVTFKSGRTAVFRSPYYIRGRGMMIPVRGGKWRNLNNSERYGARWYVKRVKYGVRVGNSASYAPYLTGTSSQAKHMARIGWRKLIDVANQNMSKITGVFDTWMSKLLKDSGLK